MKNNICIKVSRRVCDIRKNDTIMLHETFDRTENEFEYHHSIENVRQEL